jgi:hypothetical protein
MRRFIGSGFLALSLLFLGSSTQTFAAQTAVLLPATAGNYQQWMPKTGTNHVAMVDESACNGTTDYNHTATLIQRDSYGISLASVPDGSTITQVAITPCASRNTTGSGSSTLDVFYRLNAVDSADAGAYALPTGITPSILSTTSFTGLSLTKSASTMFEIGAVYSAGTKGIRLSQLTTQVTYTPLFTPSGLTAAASGGAVSLNWFDNASNEQGFKIERSDNGGAFNQIATVSANVHVYQDPGLGVGTYSYRVRAYNSGADTGYTNTATAYVLAAPSDLSAIATGSAAALSWTDNSSNEDGFRIEIATGGGSFVFYKNVGANISSASATSLSPNIYSFRVKAFKGSSSSDYTNMATVTVLVAPTGLGTSVLGSDVTLTWTDNATGEDGYRIERSDNGGGFVEINTVTADTTSYFDPGLASGNYDYRIRAYKGLDTSSYSSTASANIP